jgi:hypothetical protein
MKTIRTVTRALLELRPDPKNARRHSERNIEAIKRSIEAFGQVPTIIFNRRTRRLIAGHGTVEAMKELGHKDAQVIELSLSAEKARALGLALNRIPELAEWDEEQLSALLDSLKNEGDELFEATGFTDADLAELTADVDHARHSLAERFLAPPFSVLDARQGYWQDRKRAWLSLGIRSEIGRGSEGDHTENGLTFSKSSQPAEAYSAKERIEKGLGRKITWQEFIEQRPELCRMPTDSVFDPVLSEIAYCWFSPARGLVLDPFAGGSVRGIVASYCGRKYLGFDLRQEQVKANQAQAREICNRPMPAWICDDALKIGKHRHAKSCDFIFSCPPYGDLEVYSRDRRDLSNMPFEEFAEKYSTIIGYACTSLRDDRFACFVVGDFRDRDGIYRNFPALTVEAFAKAGLRLYNDAVLVTATGSLPIRASAQFSKSRKLGKAHQNVLVFVKGDAKKAARAMGNVEAADMSHVSEQG